MNDFTKTIVAVAAAALLAAAAYLTRPAPVTEEKFAEQGELLFPAFKDPATARGLQVLQYDEAEATIRPFKIEFDGARWVIPSHHNYPADAAANLAKAASVFIGLAKEQYVTDRAAEHESLGVLRPDDPTAPLAGRGTRITISGDGGAPLADLIIGKEAPATTDSQGVTKLRRYVRLPDKNRVYAVTFDKTFSSSFADWVETDLLKMAGQAVNKLVIDRYEIDETKGVKRPVEKVILQRGAMNQQGLQPWSLVSDPPIELAADQKINDARVEEAIAALRDLRIVGVRPKPPALSDWFSGKGNKVSQLDLIDMQGRGFFVTPEGQFVANEGELSASCGDGVVYTMYFGEVLFGRGEELTAGADPIKGEKDAAEAGPEKPEGKEARYVFVRASFDESLIPMPEAPPSLTPAAEPGAEPTPTPGGGEPDPASPAEPEDPAGEGEPSATPTGSAAPPEPSPEDPAIAEYNRKLEGRKKTIEDGKKRAESLQKRFAPWYYVIESEAFGKLRPTGADVLTKVDPSVPAPGPGPGPGQSQMMPTGMPPMPQ